MTFPSAFSVRSVKKVLSARDATSKTGELLIVYSTTKMDAGPDVMSCFLMNIDFVYSIMMVALLAASYRSHVASVHSTASYCPMN